MSRNNDQTGQKDEDSARTLDAVKPLYELGSYVGGYKLLSVLGEGGFGIVYLAEEEHPIKRLVALKVIKPGMDTKQVVARFETERQASAMLDHPNIAQLFDAGATEEGRPYFAMEYVRGIPITAYCDLCKLSTQERLKLFLPLCRAIQHAHHKGIIHRDVKPSNILVTLHDGKPIPKIIDFGVAKALNQRLTERTLVTEQGQLIGTPEYMSPEQAEVTGLDVDARTDIYSLGVLLYELLTGCTPFDPKDLRSKGYVEMQRIICELDPVKPSTKLTTLGGKLNDIARHRSITAEQLRKSVRGDLDWIVMKALEKDLRRRYETANSLAMDIEHHLNNEPVVASPPSRFYRLRKLVRRNKGVFAAVGAVAAVLLLGLCVSVCLYVREINARRRAISAEKQAETESRKSQQVAGFLEDMLTTVKPSVALGRDTTLLREILEQAMVRIGEELTDQPEVEVELRRVIGGALRELGEDAKSEAMYREALAIQRRLYGNENPDVADSLAHIALALLGQGRLAEAEPLAREALAMRRKLLGDEHPHVAESLNNLAGALSRQGKLAEAEPLAREALALRRKLLGNDHPKVAPLLANLAMVLLNRSKLAEAEPLAREALAMQQRLLGNEHPEVAQSLNNLAIILREQGKLTEAKSLAREGLAMRRRLLGSEHPDVAQSLGNLALVLRSEGNAVAAEPLAREALAVRRKLLGSEHVDVSGSLNNLALVLASQGRLTEAESLAREALALRRRLVGNEHRDVAQLQANLAEVCREQGRLTEAESLFGEALRMQRKLLGNVHMDVSGTLNSLALVLRAQGKLAEAEVTVRQALAISRELQKEHPFVAMQLNNLADLLEARGDPAGAEAMRRDALSIREEPSQAEPAP